MFKVRADFNPVMERDQDHQLAYAQWVGIFVAMKGYRTLIRARSKESSSWARGKPGIETNLASYAAVADLVREAAFWARKEDHQLVSARHVEQAFQSRVFRSNRIEEEIREMIATGTILVDITGKKVGQVNGLSVMDIGGYAFGRATGSPPAYPWDRRVSSTSNEYPI